MIRNLRCEYMVNPLGIDVAAPRLSWVFETELREWRQTAYQVLVADCPERLMDNIGNLWDSGKILSDQSAQIVYVGKPLGSRMICFWKVRVWDAEDHVSTFSESARWEMGLLAPEDWQATWIGLEPVAGPQSRFPDAAWIWYPEGNPAVQGPNDYRYFRREFSLPANAQVVRADLPLAAANNALIFLNGHEAGLASGHMSVSTHDLRAYLQPGTNLLALKARAFGGPAGVLGQLDIELSTGETLTIKTEAAWKVSDHEVADWQSGTFDDHAWQSAMEVAQAGDEPWRLPDITPSTPCPHLRKNFTLAGQPIRARLYATALGIYEARINGQKVGEAIFAPGWTDYHVRAQYQTYDVTDMLCSGENVLGMILSDGWYAGYVGGAGRNLYGPSPLGKCQLEVDYTDGTSLIITSGASWQASHGPFVQADLLMGEVYDARQEITGWDRAGHDTDGWLPVVTKKVEVQLDAQRGPGVRRLLELPVQAITEPVRGRFIFDLGQNMVGWARLKVTGKAGERVVLRFAEVLNPDGTLYTTNLRDARCIDEYILKGDEEEIYEPTFTFHGFRYVEVSGYSGPIIPEMITGVVVGSALPPSGDFTCSSPLVNQLQRNIQWGQRGNFLSVPTDCPQRDERLGWLGDAQIFIRTAAFNADVAGFFTKWLVDVDDAQHPDGAFTDVAPNVLGAQGGTAGWAEAGVICPWSVYLCYGDTRVIEQHYPAMVRWIDYCIAHSDELIRPADGYGDWLSIGADTPKDLLGTAYFAYSTSLLAKMARIIGKTDDAVKYETLFRHIKEAFIARYVSADGRVEGDTQTGYVLALHFDLLPEPLREAAARHLVEDIENKGGHLSTGFLGVGYLMPTLTSIGGLEVAYRLLQNDTFPSWGYSIKHGATTIWERWDGWTAEHGFQDPGMNSFNHYSLGSVGEWLYDTVAGIGVDPARPGYQHVIIHPRPGGGLTSASGYCESVYGRIASAWGIEHGLFMLDITIPANTTATVHIPATTIGDVRENDFSIGIDFLHMEDGCAVFRVGSGQYHFTSPITGEMISG